MKDLTFLLFYYCNPSPFRKLIKSSTSILSPLISITYVSNIVDHIFMLYFLHTFLSALMASSVLLMIPPLVFLAFPLTCYLRSNMCHYTWTYRSVH